MDMDQFNCTYLATNALMAYALHLWMKHYDPLPLKHVTLVLLIVPIISTYITVRMVQDVSLSLLVGAAPTSYIVLSSILAFCVVAYRLSSYHPLAKYPGPKILKVTKLWGAWIAYTGKSHEYLKGLHDKYGATIRIGPNELSTIEKEFIPQIFGSQGMPKGPLWDGRRFSSSSNKEIDSLVSVRDSARHAQLRKPWNQAFTAEPLQDYETLLLTRLVQLNCLLKEIVETSTEGVGHVDITTWINSFSFDFMGDLAFGGAFQVMQGGDSSGIQIMEDGLFLISITQHVPWIAKFLHTFPILKTGMQRFIKFGIEHGINRANMKINRKDLFYHIAQSSNSFDSDLPIIMSNALIAIVAGYDTTATVMSSAIYFLLANPETYKRLQDEIDAAFDEYEIPDMMSSIEQISKHHFDILGHLPYLNAVINESLRLFPPVATGLQRAPAKGSGGKLLKGISAADIYLPEGNVITVPPYIIHRDPRYFSPRPNSFLPERWVSSTTLDSTSEHIIARDAFIPFSFGPQNCVGRPLALMELRYGLSSLVRNFFMEFDTAAFDPSMWEGQFLDRFVLSRGKISVVLTIRKKARRD